MTKPTDPTPGPQPPPDPESDRGNGGVARRRQAEFPRRRLRARRGSGSEGRQARLHRAQRCRSAVRRQGQGLLRQARHARCRGAEAGLLGHHARQPRAGLGRQRHRRRAYPDPDAVPDLGRQGDAEQSADADVHPGPAQSRRAVHLGRQGIRRPQGRRRHRAVQGGAGEEEGLRQGDQGRDDLPGRHPRSVDPLLARRRRHRSRQGHRNHRGAAAADGRQHEGRHHGLLLRRRAVEPAADPSEDRLHRGQHRRNLEQASGKIVRHARRLGRQKSEGCESDTMAVHGSPAMGRQGREQGRTRHHHGQAAMDQLPGRRHYSIAPRASSTTAPARWSRTARTS